MTTPTFPRSARGLAFGAAVALSLGVAACDDGETLDGLTAPQQSGSVSLERTANALQQRVIVSPARPASGDTVAVRSVLVNRGTAPVRIEHVVCGLDYENTTILQNPFILCAAYSMTSTLAPGDSIVQQDRRVVAARPGDYRLRVRHVAPPSGLYLDVPLTVR
jgi:hypothetical protein